MKSLLLVAALAVLPLCISSTAAHAAAEVGKPAPEFIANDINGDHVMLSALKGKTVVLEWTNAGCPFVKKQYDSKNMQETQAQAVAEGAVWITINSGAKGEQGYVTPDAAKKLHTDQKSAFSNYVIDESGEIGKLYGAKTTPHMFVINKEGTLVYNGAIDDKSGTDIEEVKTAKNHVLAALADLKDNKPVAVATTKPYGCNVKYK